MPEHEYLKSYSNGNLEVIECEGCGYRHLWPLPTPDDLRTIYETQFGGGVRSQFSERKKQDAEHWRRVFTRREQVYREMLGSLEGKRVLDIGCGVGDFLSFFDERNCDVWGVEPSSNFHEQLRNMGVNLFPCLLEDITAKQWEDAGSFDVVNMSMFLEHVLDPVATIRTAVETLAPGGVLSIECPNDFNPMQLAAAEANDLPMWWINRLHINYFDFDSLEDMCRTVGCIPEYRSTQFPLEMFLLFGENYVGDDTLGREVHQKRIRFEKGMCDSAGEGAIEDLYQSLAAQSVGRQAIVYARKTGG